MRFYVYENWTNTFTKVHRGDCTFCNNGRGFQGRGSSTPSGRWHGPYTSAASALGDAQRLANQHSNRDVWIVDTCKTCAPA
jgi:hypothetical protein